MTRSRCGLMRSAASMSWPRSCTRGGWAFHQRASTLQTQAPWASGGTDSLGRPCGQRRVDVYNSASEACWRLRLHAIQHPACPGSRASRGLKCRVTCQGHIGGGGASARSRRRAIVGVPCTRECGPFPWQLKPPQSLLAHCRRFHPHPKVKGR